MQFPGQGKPPVGIVFDTGMNRIDDALALSLLYGFDGKNEARVIAVSVSRPNLEAAAYCDAVGHFYAGPVSTAFFSFSRTLPIGLADGNGRDDTPMVDAVLAKKKDDGTPVYPRGIAKLDDTAEVRALIRNALTAQYDRNAIVVLGGPATDLAGVLELYGVKDLIASKVRFLAIAGGAYPDGPPDANIQADIPAAKKLFAEWPTPIIASGHEIGAALLYPAASIEKDFAWSPAHPVVDAYRAYKPMPYDAPTWDLSAVLYSARPQEGYFQLSAPGAIRVLDDGRTTFTAAAEGKHRYLILDPAQKERILKTYTEIASAKPVVRVRRFRRPKQQVAPPPKPPEAAPKP
ncbi:MAG: nucleoside hydrolase [Pseudomonadota bacterium]